MVSKKSKDATPTEENLAAHARAVAEALVTGRAQGILEAHRIAEARVEEMRIHNAAVRQASIRWKLELHGFGPSVPNLSEISEDFRDSGHTVEFARVSDERGEVHTAGGSTKTTSTASASTTTEATR